MMKLKDFYAKRMKKRKKLLKAVENSINTYEEIMWHLSVLRVKLIGFWTV